MAKARQIGTTAVAPLIGRKKTGQNKKQSVKRIYVSAKPAHNKKRRKKIGSPMDKIGGTLELVAATLGGIYVSNVLNKSNILKPKTSTDFDARPFVGVAGGVAMAIFVKNPMAKAAGMGLAADSAMFLIPDSAIPTIGAMDSNLEASRKIIRLPMNGARQIGYKKQQKRLAGGNAYSVSPLMGVTPYDNRAFAGCVY